LFDADFFGPLLLLQESHGQVAPERRVKFKISKQLGALGMGEFTIDQALEFQRVHSAPPIDSILVALGFMCEPGPKSAAGFEEPIFDGLDGNAQVLSELIITPSLGVL